MSRVVVVKYTDNADNKFLDKKQYRRLLDAAIDLLSGDTPSASYLRNKFPGGALGMKTNCLAAFNPTLLPLVDAFSDIIKDKAGLDDNDLIIWERTNRELKRAGFTLNASSFGRRCLGTDSNGIGYDDEQFFNSGKVDSMVTNILTKMVDHSVNMGVLKHHSIAGLSAGMKNMYGAIHNPNKYHGNNCSPFAAEINQLEPIRKKHRLTIIDAVRVQYDRGPGYNSKSLDYYNGIVLSEDPVAADRIALDILDHLRVKNGLGQMFKTGQMVRYLKAGEKIGLGVENPDNIDLQVIGLSSNGMITEMELF